MTDCLSLLNQVCSHHILLSHPDTKTTMPFRKVSKQITTACKDQSFLNLIENMEGIVSKLLSVAMLLVILVAIFDLGNFLIRELFSEPYGFFNTTLIEIFGLFLNILIALEILDNIVAYLKKHTIQVELVIITSLIAVARKLIILDLTKTTGTQLIGLAIAIIALSISYWLIRLTNARQSR
jgi:uncharacterized membrane protein (DUF373 family)